MKELPWKAPTLVVGDVVAAEVHEHVLVRSPSALEHWLACRSLWRDGGRCRRCNASWSAACTDCDYSVWQQYAALVQSRRYHFANRKGTAPYGFGEAVVAASLEGLGFTTWTAVHVFGKRQRKPWRVRNTRAVEALLSQQGFPLPRRFQADIRDVAGEDCEPKNPDIAAFCAERQEWRFCEVKRDDAQVRDTVNDRQLVGLVLLHLLTGAQIAVVRLVADGHDETPRSYRVRFKLPSTALRDIRVVRS